VLVIVDKKLALRIERLEAARTIENILARYVNYHSASMQEETVELFAKKTPGIRLIFNGDVYEGYEGVKLHFLERMANAEQDLTGRLYAHDLLTPLIEVAKDGQTAKTLFSTHGVETGHDKDGNLISLWSWAKYRFDFVKEDGEWKIYRLDLHTTFLTPYAGKGWTKEPCYDIIGNAPDDFAKLNKPHAVTEVPYKPLSLTSPDCDIHNLIPAPPLPYDTWDED
jgi:hypothetical protein